MERSDKPPAPGVTANPPAGSAGAGGAPAEVPSTEGQAGTPGRLSTAGVERRGKGPAAGVGVSPRPNFRSLTPLLNSAAQPPWRAGLPLGGGDLRRRTAHRHQRAG